MLGYTDWHEWFPFYHDVIYISFTALLLILIILLSFISVYHVVTTYIVLCTITFSFTHTLIRSLLTTLNSHVQDFGHLVTLFRCSLSSYASRGAGLLSLLILVFFSFFIPAAILLILVYHTYLLFHSLFHLGSCVVIICIIAVIVDYYGLDL